MAWERSGNTQHELVWATRDTSFPLAWIGCILFLLKQWGRWQSGFYWLMSSVEWEVENRIGSSLDKLSLPGPIDFMNNYLQSFCLNS